MSASSSAQATYHTAPRDDCFWVSLAVILLGTNQSRELWRRKAFRDALGPFNTPGDVQNPAGVVAALVRLGISCHLPSPLAWNGLPTSEQIIDEVVRPVQIAQGHNTFMASIRARIHGLKEAAYAHSFNLEACHPSAATPCKAGCTLAKLHFKDYQYSPVGLISDGFFISRIANIVAPYPGNFSVHFEVISFTNHAAARATALSFPCDC